MRPSHTVVTSSVLQRTSTHINRPIPFTFRIGIELKRAIIDVNSIVSGRNCDILTSIIAHPLTLTSRALPDLCHYPDQTTPWDQLLQFASGGVIGYVRKVFLGYVLHVSK